MRAFEIHCHAKQVKRSTGRSSVAAAAYRSGEKLVDERTGEVHDYTKKQGVEHSRIYTPDNAPEWANDRAKLWNAVEAKENRKNSQTAHELVVAFPSEFDPMQRREAGDTIARELVQRYGVAVDISYHTPEEQPRFRDLEKDEDPTDTKAHPNYHAHILFTQRAFDELSADGWAKTKYRDLAADTKDADKNFYLDDKGEKTTRGKLEIKDLRAFAAGEMNRIAERDGLEVFTHHLSFEERGIDQEPTQKMGVKASALEARGIATERGELNREIKAANDNREQLKQNIIDLESEREKRGLELIQRAVIEEQHNDMLFALAAKHKHFDYHRIGVDRAEQELQEAKDKLAEQSLLDKVLRREQEIQAEIEARELNLQNAKARLFELVSVADKAAVLDGSFEYGGVSSGDRQKAEAAAEREAEAARYEKEQTELKQLEAELESRSNADRILGAITGKTRQQKARIAEIVETSKTYEEKQRQAEQSQVQRVIEQKEQAQKEQEKKRANDNQTLQTQPSKPELSVVGRDFEQSAENERDELKELEDRAAQLESSIKASSEEREKSREQDRGEDLER